MPIFETDPLHDPRWREFLTRHAAASVFHSPEWLQALHRTYGFEPIVLTPSPPEVELNSAIVLCGIDSWLTGRRLVSLPFSDHCQPLSDNRQDSTLILEALERELDRRRLEYIELRPVQPFDPQPGEQGSGQLQQGDTYCLHRIDLTPDLEVLFDQCHRDSTQRKVRRAAREGLEYEEGRSADLIERFYRLQVLTRRRHSLPPQPKTWFENLADSFGEALKIRVARKNRKDVAAILTIRYKHTLTYKYGCSDAQYHSVGGMQMLLWESIRDAKQDGLAAFDLGRSDWDDPGLIRFKDRWGAERSTLIYLRLQAPGRAKKPSAATDWRGRTVRRLVPLLPEPALRSAASLLYKHIG